MVESGDDAARERREGLSIKVDPFFIRRTSLVANQTLLKLGDYNLVGAPAFISLTELKLLVVLTAREVGLFSRFAATTSTLLLVFDLPGRKDQTRFLLRASLEALEPVAGRVNICIARLRVKTMPPELAELLIAFMDEYLNRKDNVERFAGQWIDLDGEDARLLGLAGKPLVLADGLPADARATAVTATRLKFEATEAIPAAGALVLRLPGPWGQVSVDCALPEGWAPAKGSNEVGLVFSNEFVALVEDYWYKKARSLR